MFNPFGWLKPVGKWVKKAFNFVEKYVSDEMLEKAVSLVKAARDKFPTSPERRDWVVAELMKIGLPEHLARLAVELAVGIVKKEMAD